MPNQGIWGIDRDFFATETLTIGGTAVGLTVAIYAPATAVAPQQPASYAVITVEGDQVRFWPTGDPTATLGILLNVNDMVELHGVNEIRTFRAIRVTNNATLQVAYAR